MLINLNVKQIYYCITNIFIIYIYNFKITLEIRMHIKYINKIKITLKYRKYYITVIEIILIHLITLYNN